MLDLGKIKRRYFAIKIGGKILEVEPPKLKTLKKITEVFDGMSGDELPPDQIEELTGVIADVLSKNKKGTKITGSFVEENLNLDEMILVMEEYFGWVNTIKDDPN